METTMPRRIPASERITLLALLGGRDAVCAARLLGRLLRRQPRARVATVTPTRYPMPPGGLVELMGRLERARVTHVILLPDRALLGQCAGLHPAVTALTADVPQAESLVAASDMVVLDLDDRQLRLSAAARSERVFTYSERRKEADLSVRDLRLLPDRTEFTALTVGQLQRLRLPAPDGAALYQTLCAYACGLCLGLAPEDMARTLGS